MWSHTTLEPFVSGSWWSVLSDDNKASLYSNGRHFHFTDHATKDWAVFSAGLNIANWAKRTTAFAKLDFGLGKEIEGVGGELGLRIAW
jgi:hypothetical protein